VLVCVLLLQVGDLMPAIKARFQDANRNLGAQALLLLASLARAMGRPIAREARPVLGPAVKCICDSKTQVSKHTMPEEELCADSLPRCGSRAA
jgi:hypothetical protein